VQRDEVEVSEAHPGFSQSGVDGGSANEWDQDLANRGAIHRERCSPAAISRGEGAGPPAGVRVTSDWPPSSQLQNCKGENQSFASGTAVHKVAVPAVAEDGGEAAVAPVDRACR
jgi:hypothetical protein